MLVLVTRGRSNFYNVMINKMGTIAGDLWIKIEKASGKLQPGIVKNKQANKQEQQNKPKKNKNKRGSHSEFTCEGTVVLGR